MKLSAVVYKKVAVGKCGDSTTTGRLRLSCKYEANVECIKRVRIKAEFYNPKNESIGNVTYPSVIESSNPLFSIVGDSIVFFFDYAFFSVADSRSLNFIYVNYYIENDRGDISSKNQLRINSDCYGLDTLTYKKIFTIPVKSDTLEITLWDAQKEDGDVISVWLNDSLVLNNLVLTIAKKTFKYKLNVGTNKLIVYAVAEGGQGPNTAAVTINYDKEIRLHATLLEGRLIEIVYDPTP